MTLYWFLTPCQNLEKTNNLISRQPPHSGKKDGLTEGWNNRYLRKIHEKAEDID